MTCIRRCADEDAFAVGILIAETFRAFNLSYAPPAEQELLLGPFRHARSSDDAHRQAVAELIQAPTVLVAEVDSRIVGVLRGSPGRLHSLFVDAGYQGRGIGRELVESFEQECQRKGVTKITLASSLYAVRFYQRLGYKRSTGLRHGPCFDGNGFPTQPMKKILSEARDLQPGVH
jgi:GNAT superfamily N-acetyltransferase